MFIFGASVYIFHKTIFAYKHFIFICIESIVETLVNKII